MREKLFEKGDKVVIYDLMQQKNFEGVVVDTMRIQNLFVDEYKYVVEYEIPDKKTARRWVYGDTLRKVK